MTDEQLAPPSHALEDPLDELEITSRDGHKFDRGLVEGLAGSVGFEELDFDSEGRLPRDTIESLQTQMKPLLGDVAQIADAVRYVVTQPVELNIEEIVIRPPKQLDL